jgi:hypothetical protein
MSEDRIHARFGAITRVLVMSAAIVLAGCSEKPAPPPVAAPASIDRGATFEQDSMRDWFIESSVADVPGTEEDILATFGVADSVVRLPAANAQDPMKFDTVIEAHYPGLAATILKVDGNQLLQSVFVTDTAHITGPITIGTDTTTLRRLLGAPMLGGELPGYICGKCSSAGEQVRFKLVDGKVTGMLFEFPS